MGKANRDRDRERQRERERGENERLVFGCVKQNTSQMYAKAKQTQSTKSIVINYIIIKKKKVALISGSKKIVKKATERCFWIKAKENKNFQKS